MKVFDAVRSIHLDSDAYLGVHATFKMNLGSDHVTTYLMECCQDLLKCSLRLLFPDSDFVFHTNEEAAEFTLEMTENWSEHEDRIFDLFVQALTFRYPHIKYTANKKHAEPMPWH